jgi:hypothetical protein
MGSGLTTAIRNDTLDVGLSPTAPTGNAGVVVRAIGAGGTRRGGTRRGGTRRGGTRRGGTRRDGTPEAVVGG